MAPFVHKQDCKDADPHTAAMGLRQMTDFSLKKAVVFREYAFDGIRGNLNVRYLRDKKKMDLTQPAAQ